MKKLFIFLFLMLFVVVIIITANNSHAATIFSNYGSGDTHSTSGGWAVLYFNVEPPYTQTDTDWDEGMSFTPNDDYYLDTIEFTAGLVVGSNQLDVWLMSSSDNMPDTIIETFYFSDSMENHSWSHHTPLLANSTLNPILHADTAYWLVLSTPEEGSMVYWYQNSIGQTGPRALWMDDHWDIADNVTPAVFRISGSPVPEPATMLLLSSGLVGLVGFRRRFKK